MKGTGPAESPDASHRNAYWAGFADGKEGVKGKAKDYPMRLRGWYKQGRREGRQYKRVTGAYKL